MFFKNSKKHPFKQSVGYDHQTEKPILKCSICNGEQVAGFKNLHTGEFREIMLVKNESDLKHFKEMYGIAEVPKEY